MSEHNTNNIPKAVQKSLLKLFTIIIAVFILLLLTTPLKNFKLLMLYIIIFCISIYCIGSRYLLFRYRKYDYISGVVVEIQRSSILDKIVDSTAKQSVTIMSDDKYYRFTNNDRKVKLKSKIDLYLPQGTLDFLKFSDGCYNIKSILFMDVVENSINTTYKKKEKL